MPVAAAMDSNGAAAGWLHFTPLTFGQGSLNGFDILAVDVARAVPPRSKVCELYGGVGVLGLTALMARHLHCSDENPANARCFYRTVESLQPDMTGYITERQQQRNAQRGNQRQDQPRHQGYHRFDSG
jgi:hypothetical protein